MSDERLYAEDEVAAIFETAARDRDPAGRALVPRSGLSLRELQAIGAEVGIAPDRIAQAAVALDARRGVAPRRTHLGLPVSVGQTVELPRALTDREWGQLVAELRTTFGAHGKEESRGEMRAWRNGNLHAYVEATDTGHRLRLGTVKGDGAPLGRLGLGGLLGSAALLPAFLVTGTLGEGLAISVVMATMGVAALGSNLVRLPRWAAEREAQMAHIAARARTLVQADGPSPALGDGRDG